MSFHKKETEKNELVARPGDIQRQALQWLQKLCLLKIPVPIPVLLEMFNAGVDALKEDQSQNTNAAEAEAGGEANSQEGVAGNDASGGGDTAGLATVSIFFFFPFSRKNHTTLFLINKGQSKSA